MSWLSHVAGLDNPGGAWYLFWSGIGADLARIGYLASFLVIVRRWHCHARGCWRFGHHSVERDGVTYMLCRKHLPAG